ncbi:MAG: hypothetical protein V1732_00175 [Patescibacteria group bacterium]|nr:hypothetical protein [Patescibacteria group bacterium]MBU4141594.1 hypothetical protein [Patescibacteria group bacterium]
MNITKIINKIALIEFSICMLLRISRMSIASAKIIAWRVEFDRTLKGVFWGAKIVLE